jgi:hypothetical protein
MLGFNLYFQMFLYNALVQSCYIVSHDLTEGSIKGSPSVLMNVDRMCIIYIREMALNFSGVHDSLCKNAINVSKNV